MRTRSKWYAAAVVVGLVAATPVTLRQLSRDRPVPPKGDPPSERVRVEHDLVTADVLEPARVVSAGIGAARITGRVVTTPRRPSLTRAAAGPTAPGSTTFGQKARRAFLGDGRHRPQPFPTVR